MAIIDTHCHLYAAEFEADRAMIIQQAQAMGISNIFLPAINAETHTAMLHLETEYPNFCYAMMGLHPCYVNENYLSELDIVQQWLNKKSFIAVGEIGLDKYWSDSFFKAQIAAFEQQMQWALDKKLPIVIHSRNAMPETIACVKPFADKGLKGIFHCFSGSVEEANEIIGMGFLLGIGGVVTYKKNPLQAVVQAVDLAHLVLETDAPYLAPTPHRGKRNDPNYLSFIIEKIATLKNMTPQEVAAITTKNAEKLFLTQGK